MLCVLFISCSREDRGESLGFSYALQKVAPEWHLRVNTNPQTQCLRAFHLVETRGIENIA